MECALNDFVTATGLANGLNKVPWYNTVLVLNRDFILNCLDTW
jgi:hypothetical protein